MTNPQAKNLIPDLPKKQLTWRQIRSKLDKAESEVGQMSRSLFAIAEQSEPPGLFRHGFLAERVHASTTQALTMLEAAIRACEDEGDPMPFLALAYEGLASLPAMAQQSIAYCDEAASAAREAASPGK